MENNKGRKHEKGSAEMHEPQSIIKAAWDCNHSLLNSILDEDENCVNDQDENGLTAAHISVGLSNYAFLRKITSVSEFDPLITDSFNRRAIDCITRPKMEKFRNLLLHKMYGFFPELEAELSPLPK
ncbi:MAG: hypothetical protein COA74_11715 [Gammaproteobacteria bacterium]|nr:MAG: hypothetical protein COA74_11715 [Gammaproteobacteria bacterium]